MYSFICYYAAININKFNYLLFSTTGQINQPI